MSDSDLITAMYHERGRDDGHAHFPGSSPSFQHDIAARFERVKAAALAQLAAGG